MSKKWWLLGIGLLLMPMRVLAREGRPRLSLSVKDQGGYVWVEVGLEPRGVEVSGVETTIRFEPDKLQFVGYEKTDLLPVELISPSEGLGKIHFALAMNPGEGGGVKEEGSLVKLKFERKEKEMGEIMTEETMITSLASEKNLSGGEVVWHQSQSFWQRLINWLISLFKLKN